MPMGGITRSSARSEGPQPERQSRNMPPIGIYNRGVRGRLKSSIKCGAASRRGQDQCSRSAACRAARYRNRSFSAGIRASRMVASPRVNEAPRTSATGRPAVLPRVSSAADASSSATARTVDFMIRPSSFPVHTPATQSGVKPTNQASFQRWLVPVLPAATRPKAARLPVPGLLGSSGSIELDA